MLKQRTKELVNNRRTCGHIIPFKGVRYLQRYIGRPGRMKGCSSWESRGRATRRIYRGRTVSPASSSLGLVASGVNTSVLNLLKCQMNAILVPTTPRARYANNTSRINTLCFP